MPDIPAEAFDWFASHTHKSASFPAETLVEHKGDLRVSVILPAKNEAETIGGIITSIRTSLVEALPLVDEIIVIDSHSSDDTTRIAIEAGAAVFHVDDILPALGSNPGKGEAMWKALAVMNGDIGIYLDADVLDFSPDFVTGLLGPMLMDNQLVFVKGFYDRPWNSPGAGQPTGGGRVTELVARPLILNRAPLLAGFVQPLAGECAFRFDALSAVPFVSGYGVDIGLMIDVADTHGLSAMAQVDLGVRKHSHQDLAALSAMAQHIHAAFELRCADSTVDSVSGNVVGFTRNTDAAMTMQARTEVTSQRPPMRDVLPPHSSA